MEIEILVIGHTRCLNCGDLVLRGLEVGTLPTLTRDWHPRNGLQECPGAKKARVSETAWTKVSGMDDPGLQKVLEDDRRFW